MQFLRAYFSRYPQNGSKPPASQGYLRIDDILCAVEPSKGPDTGQVLSECRFPALVFLLTDPQTSQKGLHIFHRRYPVHNHIHTTIEKARFVHVFDALNSIFF